MSSTTVDCLTYWCHGCDMSISTPTPTTTTTTTFLCPHCHTDFLQQMDSSFISPSPTLSPNHDNFLISSPYLHRLIHHISTSDHPHLPPATTFTHHQLPTSKSTISSLPTLTITESRLKTDGIILCAVCKDEFVINNQVKQLPCKHLFHQDCIFPWLESSNTCPVCRFTLPVEAAEEERMRRQRRRRRRERFGWLRMYEDVFEAWSNLNVDGMRDTRMVFSGGPREEEMGVFEGGHGVVEIVSGSMVDGSGAAEIGGSGGVDVDANDDML